MILDEMIRGAYVDALRRHSGVQARAAEELGVPKATFWREYKRFGITVEEVDEEAEAVARAIAECEAIRERRLECLRAENATLRLLMANLPGRNAQEKSAKSMAAGA